MSSYDRRAAARRRAWGRGPVILRFEPLEGRQLLTTVGPMADLVATQFNTVNTANWGDLIHATGTIANAGTATTTAPVEVDIYASTTPTLTAAGAVTDLLGSVQVPAGLAPGATYSFDTIVGLPPSTTADATSASIYVTLRVDPYNAIPEGNQLDKQGLGIGVDTSSLSILPHQPAVLVGKAISVSPLFTSTPGVLSWGDGFTVSEQITNTGIGNAPPTRARIVLTPAGATPGGYSDVTIGNINVPAIAAFQTTNVLQGVILPPIEPSTLGNATSFTISIVQDADFLTQPIYPQVANQGAGVDSGPLGILPGPLASTPQGPLPDLAPSSVAVSQNTLEWGQQFQVSTVIQNVSNVDAGPFRVRFVATGISGDVSHGVFLGDAMVGGLAANSTTNVLATVHLPAKLPYGVSIASPTYAKIYAIADPEDVVNESMRSNNMASSAPVLLAVAGTSTNTTVPTYAQNIYTAPALATQAAQQAVKAQAAATKAVRLGTAKPASSTKKPVKKHSVNLLASISESITKTIVNAVKGIPKGVNSLLNNIGGSTSSGTSTANTSTAATTTATTAAATTTATNNFATTATSGTLPSTSVAVGNASTVTSAFNGRDVRRDRRIQRHQPRGRRRTLSLGPLELIPRRSCEMGKLKELGEIMRNGESVNIGTIAGTMQSPGSPRFPSICPAFGRCGKKLERKMEIIWAVC